MSLEIINPAYLSSLVDTALPLIQTGAPVVASLVILEGLLSVDNALVLAAMVKHLPEKQSKLALKAGLLGAYVGRGAMLLCASFILRNPWLKLLGGGYLVWLMVSNLGKAEEGEGEDEVKSSKGGFWQTVLAVELADLAFSVDNVAAAVAMSDQLWAVFDRCGYRHPSHAIRRRHLRELDPQVPHSRTDCLLTSGLDRYSANCGRARHLQCRRSL
ncbi:MAG: hypothetical protein HC888_19725 [Candidatus Competibacteraceae bacterium]|nr:hypothetical protein [Candidatus Competibacteraceae bacterium]